MVGESIEELYRHEFCATLSPSSTAHFPPLPLQPLFKEQGVCSGEVLVQLTDAHLKEMGVTKVGHRLGIASCIRRLCKRDRQVTGDSLANIDVCGLIQE